MPPKVAEKHSPFKSGAFDDVSMTVGAESSNTVTINCQFKAGMKSTVSPIAGRMYVSDDSVGLDVVAIPLSTGFANGTNGSITNVEHGTSVIGKHANFVTEANGKLDVQLIHSGAKDTYLVIVLPSGELKISSKASFT